MSLPLKTGADLYNCEAQRMRLHNLGADPTEYDAGLIYFNTGSANTAGKIRVCMGSGSPLWKTLAYAEDLDVASNSDFIELKNKVDAFLGGGVDADNVLENLAEVQKFLDNYSGATSLSEILNGKLDKSGGTIENKNVGAFSIKRKAAYAASLIKFENNDGVLGYLGISQNSVPLFSPDLVTYNTLLHTGNIGSLENSIVPKDDSTYSLGDTSKRWAGVWTDEINGYTPITSNNIGDYAVKINRKLDLTSSVNEAGYGYTGQGWPTSGVAIIVGDSSDYRMAFQGYYGSSIGACLQYNYCFGGEWSDWKTIAFTDSTVAAAKALVNGAGTQSITVSSAGQLKTTGWGIGDVSSNWQFCTAGYVGGMSDALSDGIIISASKGVMLKTSSIGFVLNSSGNVTIGASDKAGTTRKLYVDGGIEVNGTSYINGRLDVISDSNNTLSSRLSMNDYGFRIQPASENAYMNTILNNSGGNVLIGNTQDDGSGAKLQVTGNMSVSNEIFMGINKALCFKNTASERVWAIFVNSNDILQIGANAINGIELGKDTTIKGDLKVTGNIIATGEVSAGGAAEEGGTSTGGGDGLERKCDDIPTGKTEHTFNHTLATTDVSVSLYEWNANNQSWDMCLADIEVKKDSVKVTFGSATTVPHRLVVIG